MWCFYLFQVKSEVIATYALCGFANFGSIGITLGAVGALAPSKKPDLAAMSLRSMICGNVACFLTACIAGMYIALFNMAEYASLKIENKRYFHVNLVILLNEKRCSSLLFYFLEIIHVYLESAGK